MENKKPSLYLLMFLLLLSFASYGQSSDYGSITNTYELRSKQQHSYQLKVSLPTHFDSNKTYKVLYYLDAWWLSELVLGNHALLHLTDMIDDVVLVGISLNGNGYAWNTQRNRDFTPSPYDFDKMRISFRTGTKENAAEINAQTTGGANDFITFLADQALPFIEKKYPKLKKERGFIGHSFGGLFGIYALQQRPDLFNELIIISGALWWNKQEIIQPQFFAALEKKKKATKLFVTYGGQESKLITKSNIALNEILKEKKVKNFHYHFERYEKANHNSILSRAIYDGLLFLYKKE